MLEPKNEQGVILSFANVCSGMGYEILSIQSAYPDTLLLDRLSNSTLLAEFEYHADNFYAHKHDPSKVDLVICWERGNRKFPVPVLEMSTLVSYPPNLYKRRVLLGYEARKPSDKAKYRGIFIWKDDKDNLITIHERTDGTQASIMFFDDLDRPQYIEVNKDDISEASELMWKAISLCEKAGKRGDKNPALAREIVDMIRYIIDLVMCH